MTEEEKTTPTASEVEAKQFGWMPLEDFKGDQEQWRDADEFLKRGREINGYLRNDLDKIQKKNQQLESELSQVRDAVGKFKDFHEKTEERAYARALEELKLQKKQAIESSDGDAVVAIDDQIDELKESRQEVKSIPATDNKRFEAEFSSWVSENPWYRDDKALRATANGFADEVKAENPGLMGRPFLEAVEKKVKEALPDKFTNTSRNSPSAVEGSSGQGQGGSRKKSYADLPQEAKAACDQFVKEKLLTREQYIADFYSEE